MVKLTPIAVKVENNWHGAMQPLYFQATMPPALSFSHDGVCDAHARRLRVGFDLVEIGSIRESLQAFGERFLTRLFRDEEIGYALQGAECCAERLAARFAAKEATLKALSLSEVGVNWRDIEVRKLPDGACRLELHGEVARHAKSLGITELALSLSHDGDYAGAVVTAACHAAATESTSHPERPA